MPLGVPHACGLRGAFGGVADPVPRRISRPGMMYTLGGGLARAKVGACEVHDKHGPLASPKTGGGLAGHTWAAASEPTSGGLAFAGGPGGSVTGNQRGIESGLRHAIVAIPCRDLRDAVTVRELARQSIVPAPSHIDQRGYRYAAAWWLQARSGRQWEHAWRAQI